eukprot:1382480-Amphidinium_carterae.1
MTKKKHRLHGWQESIQRVSEGKGKGKYQSRPCQVKRSKPKARRHTTALDHTDHTTTHAYGRPNPGKYDTKGKGKNKGRSKGTCENYTQGL